MTEEPSNPGQDPNRSLDTGTARSEVTGASPSGDVSLIERVRARDQAAMVEIFDRYATMVYSVALRVLRDSAQAEDVMQEVLLQIWNDPKPFVQGRGSLGAWLAVVVRNRAIDALRKRRHTEPCEEVVLASSTNLATEVERDRMMAKVRGILKSLPDEQQRSVELAFFEGLSHSEIAARTGDPLGTVKTRIRAALTSLRRGMEE